MLPVIATLYGGGGRQPNIPLTVEFQPETFANQDSTSIMSNNRMAMFVRPLSRDKENDALEEQHDVSILEK